MENDGGRGRRRTDESGLILPRKLVNPCLESKQAVEVHREMKWNAKK